MSVRQEKFSGLLQQHLAELFTRHPEWIGKAFVTISKVEVSPDLGYAKIYLSFFKPENRDALLATVQLHSREIRKALAAKIKNQARIVPELNFLIDDSLDYVFHMEDVLKRVHDEDEKKRQDNH